MQDINFGGKKIKVAGNVALAAGLLLVSGMAMADPLSGGICGFYAMMTGKVMFGAAMLGIFGSLFALVWGGEITDGIKKVATIVLIVGIVMAAAKIISLIPGVTPC
jgi:hypothetical protein